MGSWYTKNNFLCKVLNLNKIFKKKLLVEKKKLVEKFSEKKITGKTTRFFVIFHFLLPILFVLTLASDRAVLYGIVALSISVLSTKKWSSGFVNGICVFQKICFKVKVLKMFKISSDCHIKTCQSVKRRASLKVLISVF